MKVPPFNGQRLEEERLAISGGDLAFCNERHINNFIILLSAVEEKEG